MIECFLLDIEFIVGFLVFCKIIVNNKYNTFIYYIIRMYNFIDVRG